MGIEWEDYLWKGARPVPDGVIQDVENVLNIKFPEDYKNVARENQGKSPTPSIFNITEKRESVFNTLLHFTDDKYDNTYNLLKAYSMAKEFLPERIIPIADTPGGDYICLDYRDASINSKIVFANHELSGDEAIYPLAKTFTELLKMLRNE
jgi:hypothetical protein